MFEHGSVSWDGDGPGSQLASQAKGQWVPGACAPATPIPGSPCSARASTWRNEHGPPSTGACQVESPGNQEPAPPRPCQDHPQVTLGVLDRGMEDAGAHCGSCRVGDSHVDVPSGL